MKTVLITGGAGFIGSDLVDNLLSDGNYKVICLDNFDDFYDPLIKHNNLYAAKLQPNFHLITGDICDKKFIEENLTGKIDVIVHLAARAGVRPSIQNPALYEYVNIRGTLNLLEFAKKNNIKQFVFGSSSSVYGVNPNFPWSENDYVLNPISPYAATKVSAELLGHTYSHLYNIRFIALRFFSVFGPRQRPDLAIHKFFKNILKNQPIPVFGDGTTRRDYTFVGDIISGIKAAMEYDQSNYETINLGNNQSIPLIELISAIENTLGKKAILEKLPMQAGDVPQTFANIDKAKRLLSYHPAIDIYEGLRYFRKWYFENTGMPVT